MNPDRTRGGMTVNALLQIVLITTTVVPVLLIALLGFLPTIPALAGTNLLIISSFCAIVVLIVGITVNYFVQRRIKDKIMGLSDVCRNYAGGDHTIRAVVNGDDEFAMLSMSLNTVLDSQDSGGTPLHGNSSDVAALQAQIEKLLQEVSAVGDGDLRVQAEVTPDTLGVLADSFNYMIEELAKVVGRVQTTAVQVTTATRRILDRASELAHASEAQVAQISQTSEAVEALAAFIQNVARNALRSVEVAQEALQSATSGQQAVRQSIDGMMLIRENVQETSKKIKRLGERSNEIGEIVRIIEDIADQTNLLALNAAIQSAMAGEHGRGFAVVADEIRLLAERSTESTKRIATLVKSIQGDTYDAVVAMEDSTQEVVKGSQLADEAGRALNSIHSAVERQAKMIESIARAANEQTPVSESVTVTMSQILEIIRQTDASTQEAAVSVSYLAELSEQLRASVSTFRLPERGNDVSSSFSPLTSVTEMADGYGAQMSPPALPPGISPIESGWGQNFSEDFPPLPEPNNADSLVALPSRAGHYAFSNQQDFGMPLSFAGAHQSGFGNQPQYNAHPSSGGFNQFGQQQSNNQPGFSNNANQQFNNQAGFDDNQQFNSQSDYGNVSGQQFNSQPGFDDMNSFESHQGFSGNGLQQYAATQQSFAGSNQRFPSSPNQMPLSQAPDPGVPSSSQQGMSSPVRQRRPIVPQQGQSPFNQDQVPFSNNG